MIPRNCFLYDEASRQVTVEGAVDGKVLVTPIESVSFDNGILVNYEGAEYPQKGLTPPEVLRDVNIVKSLFIEVFKLRPNLVSILYAFIRIGKKVLESHYLKDEYRTASTRELDSILYNFIFQLTSNDLIASHFAHIFSHLIEYDNAYRLRFVDLASETSAGKLLENPRKEIKRLLKILSEREVVFGKDIVNKFKYVSIVLRLFLLIPKYRIAFNLAIGKSKWDNMVYDNIDRYWACLRTDYNFMGMSYEDRIKLLKDNNYSIPVQKEYEL